MNIPLDEREIDVILEVLRHTRHQKLYNKFWSYKINTLIREKEKN